MSYTILQSTKIFTVIDKNNNKAVISGYVGDCNNVAPRDFLNIKFHRAAKNKGELSVQAVKYAEDVISGNIQLKNGSNNKSDDVDTIVRRFLRNLNLAKTINVESVLYDEFSIRVIFGKEGLEQLRNAEPALRINYLDDNQQIKLTLVKGEAQDHQAFRFISGSERNIEDAVDLSLTNSYLPAFFKPGTMTEGQLVTLLKNTTSWVHRYIFDRTTTRLSKETATSAFTEKEKEDLNIGAFTQK